MTEFNIIFKVVLVMVRLDFKDLIDLRDLKFLLFLRDLMGLLDLRDLMGLLVFGFWLSLTSEIWS